MNASEEFFDVLVEMLEERMKDLGRSIHKQIVIMQSVLVSFYIIGSMFMIVWQNKLISHIFLVKFLVICLQSALKLVQETVKIFVPNNVNLGPSVDIHHIPYTGFIHYFIASLNMIEQLMGCILMFELYAAICKIELREYEITKILKKVGLVSLAAACYVGLAKALERFIIMSMQLRSYRNIDDICISILITIFQMICFAKVMWTLIKNGKFNGHALLKNHYVIHLMIVLICTQTSKMISTAIFFHAEWIEVQMLKDCIDNAIVPLTEYKPEDYGYVSKDAAAKAVNHVECIKSSVVNVQWYHTGLYSLAESIYIIIIMMVKKRWICCRKDEAN